VVLDREMHIRVWNRRAEDLWGLRAEEVQGQGLLGQDIGLPVEQLKAPLRACIEGRSEQEERVLQARNRRGRAIQVRVTCTPLLGNDKDIRGAILLMEEWTDVPRAGSDDNGVAGNGTHAPAG
jgi:two-component system CheB/CheR fusion protein